MDRTNGWAVASIFWFDIDKMIDYFGAHSNDGVGFCRCKPNQPASTARETWPRAKSEYAAFYNIFSATHTY